MYLHSLSTAVPEASFTQSECADMVQASSLRHRLSRRSLLTLLTILRGDSGIDKRHFAMPEIDELFTLNPDELNEGFRREAPRLAAKALSQALEESGRLPREVDALFVCTCTGYLCPGVSSYVSELLGLRADAFLQDCVGLGCGAAVPTLRMADAWLGRHPDAVVATVAVEVCSAAFCLDDDPGVLISACLFGDGAAAALWESRPRRDQPPLRCSGFDVWHEPAHRDMIRFEQRNGRLRNLLSVMLPSLTADAVGRLWRKESQLPRPLSRIISHGGGRDVIDALETVVPGYPLDASRRTLRRYGNMSSPSVLFALHEELERSHPAEGNDWWLVAFGAGFCAHSCRMGG